MSILGDLNVNIDKHKRTPKTLKYLITPLSYGVYPIKTLPTRVTDHSSTIIDHIKTNDTLHKIIPGILRNNFISDDFPVFCNIKECTSLSPSNILSVISQNLTLMSLKKICKPLNDLVNKQPTLNVANSNRNFNNFVRSVKSVID